MVKYLGQIVNRFDKIYIGHQKKLKMHKTYILNIYILHLINTEQLKQFNITRDF